MGVKPLFCINAKLVDEAKPGSNLFLASITSYILRFAHHLTDCDVKKDV